MCTLYSVNLKVIIKFDLETKSKKKKGEKTLFFLSLIVFAQALNKDEEWKKSFGEMFVPSLYFYLMILKFWNKAIIHINESLIILNGEIVSSKLYLMVSEIWIINEALSLHKNHTFFFIWDVI